MYTRCHFLVLGVSLAAFSLPAQRTWILDKNNGPGTDFTVLETAIQTVAAADRIRIRPGNYIMPARLTKPLTFEGTGPGVVLEAIGGPPRRYMPPSFVLIESQSTSPIAFRDLAMYSFVARQCYGPIILDNVTIPNLAFSPAIDIGSCRSLTIRGCSIYGGVEAVATPVFVESSTIVGAGPNFHLPPRSPIPAILAASEDVSITASTLVGGTDSIYSAPGVLASRSQVIVHGIGSRIEAGATRSSTLGSSAIEGRQLSALLHDGNATWVPNPGYANIQGFLQTTVKPLPALTADIPGVGRVWRLQLTAPTGSSYALAIGTSIPGVYFPATESLWIQPLLVLATGTMGTTPRAVPIAVPANAPFRSDFLIQGLTLNGGIMDLTNPIPVGVR